MLNGSWAFLQREFNERYRNRPEYGNRIVVNRLGVSQGLYNDLTIDLPQIMPNQAGWLLRNMIFIESPAFERVLVSADIAPAKPVEVQDVVFD